MRIAAVCLLMLSCVGSLFPQSPTGPADTAPQGEGFDIVIANARIIDGTGSPWYSGQVGIRAGRIAAIGNLSVAPRRQTIDAMGKVVAPGFIDMLGQSELTMLVDPRLPSKIFQGITTEITGEGNSVAPASQEMFAADRASYEHLKIKPDWTLCVNTSPDWSGGARESISPAMWALPVCGGWFWAMPMCSRRLRN